MTRIIFYVALATTWRPGQLYNLEISDIMKSKKCGEWVYQMKSEIGTTIGGSKFDQGGLKAVNDKPSCVTIWRQLQLNG